MKNTSKRLHLPLKSKWYKMIESGEKPEEYRDLNLFWAKRLLKNYPTTWQRHVFNCLEKGMTKLLRGTIINGWDEAHFTLGYPKHDDQSRQMIRGIDYITIDEGNRRWGAEPGKVCFVIKLKPTYETRTTKEDRSGDSSAPVYPPET